MIQNKAIVLNVDENLLTKLAELLGGEVAEQVGSALKSQGISVPETNEVSEPEPVFGELLTHTEDDNGWTGTYYVGGAEGIELFIDDDGELRISLVDESGESGDAFNGGDEFDMANVKASVTDDILTVFVPKYVDAVPFQPIEVEGWQNSDEDECDCLGCCSDRE
jgi:hypothetical protein